MLIESKNPSLIKESNETTLKTPSVMNRSKSTTLVINRLNLPAAETERLPPISRKKLPKTKLITDRT